MRLEDINVLVEKKCVMASNGRWYLVTNNGLLTRLIITTGHPNWISEAISDLEMERVEEKLRGKHEDNN